MSLFVYNPLDLLKTRAQVNTHEFVKYRHLIADIIHKEGFRGFLKGITPGLIRDVPGTGAYFWTYQYLKTLLGLHELSDNST